MPFIFQQSVLDIQSKLIYSVRSSLVRDLSLVCWRWFNYLSKLLSPSKDEFHKKKDRDSAIYCNYRLLHRKEFIKSLKIPLKLFDKNLVSNLNRYYTSLERLDIIVLDNDKDLSLLSLLNELNTHSTTNPAQKIDIKLDIYPPKNGKVLCDEKWLKKVEFTFTLTWFQFIYNSRKTNDNFNWISTLILKLCPRNITIIPENSGFKHLEFYHTISKHNQHYQSIRIENDFIPLFSLYHFIQSPNLTSFKFSLDIKLINELYSQPPIENLDYYLELEKDNRISEDQFQNRLPTVYAKSIWEKSIELLKCNSVITELYMYQLSGVHYTEPCQQFIQDFIDIFSNNKCIKKALLEFKFINNTVLKQILDNNTTLESLTIRPLLVNQIEELKSLTSNKCKIYSFP
ncbi:hypothetical protein CYY_006404 [Polysphondylium violaceum]|uniref:F-box domain-containing protein n=1 Tax=Polysphondylium violaceum TaxID=133409 RepID=A0A8J4V361_9MYCE|nr:hypothetical protein CYY_006404 [Polysphondylium violaceum]